MVEYKRCPRCGDWIPKNWSYHKKCNWNVQKEVKAEREQLIQDMEKSISDAFEIRKRLRKRCQDANVHLDLTKVALSLFIQRIKKEGIITI